MHRPVRVSSIFHSLPNESALRLFAFVVDNPRRLCHVSITAVRCLFLRLPRRPNSDIVDLPMAVVGSGRRGGRQEGGKGAFLNAKIAFTARYVFQTSVKLSIEQ